MAPPLPPPPILAFLEPPLDILYDKTYMLHSIENCSLQQMNVTRDHSELTSVQIMQLHGDPSCKGLQQVIFKNRHRHILHYVIACTYYTVQQHRIVKRCLLTIMYFPVKKLIYAHKFCNI